MIIKEIELKDFRNYESLNLKFHIIERYKTISAKGYITMEEKEEINELYNSLKNINCQNVADEIIKNINNIPLK